MQQFINFNRLSSPPSLLPESVQKLLKIIVIATGVFAVGQVWVAYSLSNLTDQVDQIEKGIQYQRDMLTDLTALTTQIAAQESNKKALSILYEELDAKKSTMAILNGAIQGEKGYLPVLEGLSQHGVSGVWLSNVSLAQGGAILIEGYADHIQKIPLFAESLSQMSAFTNVDFSKMNVQQGEKDQPVRFSLSSTLYSLEEK